MNGARPPRLLDGVVRKGIEEAIGFLQPGASYDCSVDDHVIVIVRLQQREAPFLLACRTCAVFAGEYPLRRVYPMIHRHTDTIETDRRG